AISNCLGKRQTSRIAGERIASRAAAARRLQTDWHRRTPPGKGKGVDPLFREGGARDEHYAAVGGFMLVLPSILRPTQRQTLRRRGGGAVLDGWSEARRC